MLFDDSLLVFFALMFALVVSFTPFAPKWLVDRTASDCAERVCLNRHGFALISLFFSKDIIYVFGFFFVLFAVSLVLEAFGVKSSEPEPNKAVPQESHMSTLIKTAGEIASEIQNDVQSRYPAAPQAPAPQDKSASIETQLMDALEGLLFKESEAPKSPAPAPDDIEPPAADSSEAPAERPEEPSEPSEPSEPKVEAQAAPAESHQEVSPEAPHQTEELGDLLTKVIDHPDVEKGLNALKDMWRKG